jgi:putative phosphoribosyl transferase
VCPLMPAWMRAVGDWYEDFSQTSDQQVIELLQKAWIGDRRGL